MDWCAKPFRKLFAAIWPVKCFSRISGDPGRRIPKSPSLSLLSVFCSLSGAIASVPGLRLMTDETRSNESAVHAELSPWRCPRNRLPISSIPGCAASSSPPHLCAIPLALYPHIPFTLAPNHVFTSSHGASNPSCFYLSPPLLCSSLYFLDRTALHLSATRNCRRLHGPAFRCLAWSYCETKNERRSSPPRRRASPPAKNAKSNPSARPDVGWQPPWSARPAWQLRYFLWQTGAAQDSLFVIRA